MNSHITSNSHHRRGGFTLVELMITLVIAAILVGIAVPSYTAQIQKSRRTDARNALLDIAAREERWLSLNNQYSPLATDVGYSGAWPILLTNGYYSVSVTVPDPAAPANIPSFIITATAAGSQVNDTACTAFTVTQIGKQNAYTSGGVDNTATCWGR